MKTIQCYVDRLGRRAEDWAKSLPLWKEHCGARKSPCQLLTSCYHDCHWDQQRLVPCDHDLVNGDFPAFGQLCIFKSFIKKWSGENCMNSFP